MPKATSLSGVALHLVTVQNMLLKAAGIKAGVSAFRCSHEPRRFVLVVMGNSNVLCPKRAFTCSFRKRWFRL